MPLEAALRIVVYEGVGAQRLDATERFHAVSALLERGFTVTATDGERAVASTDGRPIVIFGKFAENRPEFSGAQMRDIAGMTPAQIADLAESTRTASGAAAHGGWKPWFP